MTQPVMIESEDTLMPSSFDNIADENIAPVSEEEASVKKMEQEKMTYAEAISKQTREDEADITVSFNDCPADKLQTADLHGSSESEEGATAVNSRISPIETKNSEVDAFPSRQTPEGEVNPSIPPNNHSADRSETKDECETSKVEEMSHDNGRITPVGIIESEADALSRRPDTDIDTDVAESPSPRIEPEGATPFFSKSSERFDDDLVDKVLSETHERQEEDRERINLSRVQQTEMAVEDQTKEIPDTKSQQTKKKRQEPPGSPAKHERQKSEFADQREQRIKDTASNLSPKNLDERGVRPTLRDEEGMVEEKKGDDDMSVQREPSGSLISSKNNGIERDHKEQSIIAGSEKPAGISTTEEEKKVEARYESPSRTSQRHHLDSENNHMAESKEIFMHEEKKAEQQYKSPSRIAQRHTLEFTGNHNVHAMSHASNQHQTHGDSTRQSTQPSSPPFFVEDDENVPIPYLPPLLVPGLGPSFDAMSLQGQGQAVHLNHNGYQQQFHQRSLLSQQLHQQHQPVLSIPNQVTTMPGGKRKIHLQLWEDVSSTMMEPETSSFLSFRRNKGILRRSPQHSTPISEVDDVNQNHNDNDNGNDPSKSNQWADRGMLTVSWYEGTSSLELQEHVQNSVIRKLGLKSTTKLVDFRVLDETSDSPEGT